MAGLHTISWGEGERRILVIHGITSSVAGWWRVGPDLAELGWEVVAADLRGHGDSPRSTTHEFDEHVSDLHALGTGWDAVLGHSMGGTVAVLASAADPAWTKGLILQDPALMLPDPMSDVLEWLLADYLADVSYERLARENPRWHPNDVTAKVEGLEKSSQEMVRATVEVNWPWMVLDAVAAPGQPTVLLGSDPVAGGILPVTIGEWLAGNPLIDYEMIAGASHSAHRDDDQYETYRTALAGALNRLPTLGG